MQPKCILDGAQYFCIAKITSNGRCRRMMHFASQADEKANLGLLSSRDSFFYNPRVRHVAAMAVAGARGRPFPPAPARPGGFVAGPRRRSAGTASSREQRTGVGAARRVRGGPAAASCASSERALTGELRAMEDWRSRERRGGGAVDEEGAEPREGGSGSADTRPRRRATGTASSQASGHLQRRRLRCDLARQRRRGRGGSVLRVGCWRWKIF
jgi:hypothetical protein